MMVGHGKKYDVVVCGCGSAGFCAAVQAARSGCKTALIEKYGMPGGIMTVMGNNHIALFNAYQTQVIKGIGWEFVKELKNRGYAYIPDFSVKGLRHSKYTVHVNIVAAAKLMDEMLIDSGVDIFYLQQAAAVDITTEENGMNRVKSVIITTKNGLKEMEAAVFIDCTGDGDICVWAGAEYECGDSISGELQPGSLRYYIKTENGLNIEDSKQDDKVIKDLIDSRQLFETDIMGYSMAIIQRANGNNVNHISNFNGADSDERTVAEIEARSSVYRVMEAIKLTGKSKDMEIVFCGPEVAARETRRIICDSYISADDYVSGVDYEDAICYSYYPIDRHVSGSNEIHQIFIEEGVYPKIPLSALFPKGISNLCVAGRCASGDRDAQSAFRVKASCMAMGQAAGAAAALAAKTQNGRVRAVRTESVRDELEKHGAIVPGRFKQ